jgi:acyl carrier protein
MRQTIRKFILNSFLFSDDELLLADGDSLLERGILDSTGVLELVAFLEAEFGAIVADEELAPENLDSVSNILAFLERKAASRQLTPFNA